jgi:hypothetical protein
LYLRTFDQADEDVEGVNTALDNATSYAILVPTGSVKKKKKRGKASLSPSILDLKDEKHSLCCVADVTVTPGDTHQFVHWLAVSDQALPASKFDTWHGRGMATLLLHFIVRWTVMLTVATNRHH